MNPGATIRPPASSTVVALLVGMNPAMDAMRPSLMPTSAPYRPLCRPSMTVPPLTSVSNSGIGRTVTPAPLAVEALLQLDGDSVAVPLGDRLAHVGLDGQLVGAVAEGHERAPEGVA